MSVRLLDSHAHLTDARYDEDREEVLRRARESGVEGVVGISSDAEDAERAVALARRFPGFLHATAGIHPHEVGAAGPDALDRVRALAEEPDAIVALGETGLDFHYDHSPRDLQMEYFRAHLELARQTGLPVVVHSRSAVAETIEVLAHEAEGVLGVLHCFTGEPELLDAVLQAGWWVSWTGIVTFPSWDRMDSVRRTPHDRFMVETDGPWLAPVPHRGKRNEPAFVRHVVDAIAHARGVTPEELGALTAENARRFFRLD